MVMFTPKRFCKENLTILYKMDSYPHMVHSYLKRIVYAQVHNSNVYSVLQSERSIKVSKAEFAAGRLCPQCSNPAPGMGPRSG